MLRETFAVSDADVAHGESADKAIDKFIDYRARQARKNGEPERPTEPSWKESERRYSAAQDAERRAEWCDYHQQQAARHRRTLRALIERHETRAALLLTDESKG